MIVENYPLRQRWH